jgi:hypothetical protein
VAQLLPDPVVKQAWGCLRRFGRFHLMEQSFETQQELDAAADEAQKELLCYGALAEQVRDRRTQ